MGSGEAVADAVLSTDLVEQHLGGLDPEAVGEDLAVVGEDLLWHPVALEGLDEEAAHSSGGGPHQDPAQTQYREWSSMPVSTLHSVPSASRDPSDHVHL